MSHLSKLLLPLLCLTLANTTAAAPQIEGHWEGAVVREGSIQVIAMDFATKAVPTGGKLVGTIDIPELGMFQEPMTEVSLDGDTLRFRFIYGPFECLLHPRMAEITGSNNNWGPPLGIHLKRHDSFRAAVEQEEVSFTNGSVTLSGTFLRPRGSHPVAAVVCVHGSAQPTREEWTYRGIGFALAQRGFAALIYDRRGNGDSTGNADEATFDDLAADAVAAAGYLKSRQDIRPEHISIFGASQGGWIGPLAASLSSDIAFVIAQTGPAVSVWEQERHSIEYVMKADERAPADIEAALAMSDRIFNFVRTGQGWDALAEAITNAKDAEWAGYVQLPDSAEDAMSWRQQDYDPAPVLRKMTTPMLVLYAEHDLYVPPSENAHKMKALLNEAGNQDFTIKVFPDVGHGMELQRTLTEDEWNWPTGYWVWSKKVPDYYQTIVEWIEQRVNTSG